MLVMCRAQGEYDDYAYTDDYGAYEGGDYGGDYGPGADYGMLLPIG